MATTDPFVIAVYGRVSDPRQAQLGHSIETQLADARKRADAMFGEHQHVVREYVDSGLSGAYPPEQMLGRGMAPRAVRPALTSLLADADNHEIDFVFFFEVGRAARDEEIHFFVQRWLEERDIGFRYLEVDVDPTTEDGKLLTGVMGLMAAHFRRVNARRIKQAWRARFAAGYPPGGPAPFGFDWEPREAVPSGGRRGYVRNEEQARWVRWMFDQYQAGWTTTRIADELVRMGVPRSRGDTITWDGGVVRKILMHPVYAGLLRTQDGELIHAQWYEDRMWEPEERELILKRLKRNRKLGSTTVNKAEYLLNGILTCAHCGRRLYAGHTPGGRRQYWCHGEHAECPGLQKVAEPVESAVVAVIRELAASTDVRELAAQQVVSILAGEAERLQEQLAALEAKLAVCDTRLDRLTDLRLDGELTQEEFAAQRKRLTDERTEVEQQADAVRAELEGQSVREAELAAIEAVLADFDRVWDALDDQEKHEALFTAVERAELRRAGPDDLELRLQVHYLPERVLHLPSGIRRGAGPGAAGLMPRELAYLKHRRDGRSDHDIAALFDVTVQSVIKLRGAIMSRLEVEDVSEAVALASRRIDAELHALPLRGRLRARRRNQPGFTWTEKRRQILRGLAAGEPRAQLAARMQHKPETLLERIRRMRKAAGVETNQELVEWARRTGLID